MIDRKSRPSRIGIIIQARVNSERLPGKILRPLGESTSMLLWVIERCRQVRNKDRVVVATTQNPVDDAVVDLCRKYAYDYYRGSETDVLDRYLSCVEAYGFDITVRITSDCPFIPPEVIEQCINLFYATSCDYVHNSRSERTFPRGLDVEVIAQEVLRRINRLAKTDSEREHVTLYIYQHPEQFEICALQASPTYYGPDLRLTVDTEEDFECASAIARQFQKEGILVDTKKIIAFLRTHPEIAGINKHIKQKAINGKFI